MYPSATLLPSTFMQIQTIRADIVGMERSTGAATEHVYYWSNGVPTLLAVRWPRGAPDTLRRVSASSNF